MTDARAVLEQFWEIQDSGDYARLGPLFADDAVVVDPVFGTFTGRQAITAFMTRMTAEMAARGFTFHLVELAADGETAWAQWEPSPRP